MIECHIVENGGNNGGLFGPVARRRTGTPRLSLGLVAGVIRDSAAELNSALELQGGERIVQLRETVEERDTPARSGPRRRRPGRKLTLADVKAAIGGEA